MNFKRLKIADRFSQYKDSKETKQLLGNFSWLMVLQIASYLFPLITMPYLARVIGVDGFGKIAFAAAVMVWINTFAEWGFNLTATRDLARNRNNPQVVNEIFSNVQYARLFMAAISFVVLFLLILIVPKLRSEALILFYTFLMVPGNILFPEWFFQGMERMKYTTLFNITIKLVFTLAIFIFIRDKEDYILQPLLNSFGFLFSGAVAQWIIIKRWGVRLIKPKWKNIWTTIKGSTDVFLNNLMPNLYNSFSTVLLGLLGTPSSNGLLDAGRRFVLVGQNLMSTLSRVFFPFLSRRIDKHRVYAMISILTASLLVLGLEVCAPLLMRWFFTQEFYPAVWVLRIMSLGIIFITVNHVYGLGYLIVEGYERKLRNTTAICSIIGFCTAFPLIYLFDWRGAAINITFSQFILGTGVYLQAKKIKMGKSKKNN